MPSTVSFWCTLDPHVRDVKTFKGKPTCRQQELEIDREEQTVMASLMDKLPLRHEHNDLTLLGWCGDHRMHPDGRWDARLDFTDATPEGRDAIRAIRAGELRGVSLKHRPGPPPVPFEISLCKQGARAGSGIYFDKATNLYTSADAPTSSIVAASEDDTDSQLRIFPVVASVMEAPAPAMKGGVPVVPEAELTERKESDTEPDAQPAGDVEMKSAEEEEEAKKAFPTTTTVGELLQQSHSIPTKAQKEAIKEAVVDLEIQSKEKDAALEQAKAEAAEKDALIEKLRAQLAEAPPPRKHGDEAVIEQMADAFAGADPETKQVLASATPEVKRALAKMGRGVAQTLIEPAESLSRAQQKIAEYQQRKRKGGPGSLPAANPADIALGTKLHSRSADLHNMFLRQPPAQAPPQAQPKVVAASAVFAPGHPDWGTPRTRPLPETTNDANRVVAASIFSSRGGDARGGAIVSASAAERAVRMGPEMEPGAGLNFEHEYMTLGQATLWGAAPAGPAQMISASHLPPVKTGYGTDTYKANLIKWMQDFKAQYPTPEEQTAAMEAFTDTPEQHQQRVQIGLARPQWQHAAQYGAR